MGNRRAKVTEVMTEFGSALCAAECHTDLISHAIPSAAAQWASGLG